MKLYIFDLDGTLLDNDKIIDEYTKNILKKLKGEKVIATSRTLEHTKRYAEYLGIKKIVFSLGSGIYDNGDINYYYMNTLKSKRIVTDLLKNYNDIKISLKKPEGYYSNYYYNNNIYTDFYNFDFNNIEKITIELIDYKIIEYLHSMDVNVSIIDNVVIVTRKNCNKYNMCEKIRKKYNIKKEDVIAFGNDLTDYDVIKNYYGIVPNNSLIELKQVAKMTCDNNTNRGVAKYIDNHIINNIKSDVIKGSAANINIDYKNRIVNKSIEINNEGISNGFTKLFYEGKFMYNSNKNNINFFPKVYKLYEEKDKFYINMEYLYDGITFRDIMKNNISNEYKKNIICKILTKLFNEFYLINPNVKMNQNYIYDNYINRVEDRLNIARKQCYKKNYNTLYSIIENGLYINETYYNCFNSYIDKIKKSSELMNKLNIQNVTKSHNDLIPSNIVTDYSEYMKDIFDFKLIDPRGEEETGVNNRHYMYDIGKLLFGLNGFDIFRMENDNLYEMSYYIKDNIYHVNYKMNKCDLNDSYNEVYKYIWDIFNNKKYEWFEDLNIINNYEFMFKFAESICFISDIPCRIMNGNSEELAILFYIRGLEIMEGIL